MQSKVRAPLSAVLGKTVTLTAVAGFSLDAQAQPAVIDPEAQPLLKASTDFLADQQQFSVDTRNTLEVVLKSGQKIEFNHMAGNRCNGRTSCAPSAPATTAQQQAGTPAAGAVVSALPAACKPETRSGVEGQNCGGVYYRSAFQGYNLVYGVH